MLIALHAAAVWIVTLAEVVAAIGLLAYASIRTIDVLAVWCGCHKELIAFVYARGREKAKKNDRPKGD